MKSRMLVLTAAMLAASAGAAFANPECKPIAPPKDVAYPGAIKLQVDATDIGRRIYHVRETVPTAAGQELVLLYPEWLPGTHAPWGRNRLNKLAGLVVSAGGKPLTWTRDDCNVFAFRIRVPQGLNSVDVAFDYLSPDGAQTGPAAHAEVSPEILVLEWSSVVLYPAGHYASRIEVEPSASLPEGWQFATALDRADDDKTPAFKRVSLETLVDSPLFAGKYAARWDLDPGAPVPVHLDAFADRPELLKPKDEKGTKDFDAHIDEHRNLIQQAYKLFGSKHYDHYDFLVTLSDNIGYAGLEHHRSSEENTSPDYFTDWDKTLVGRDLLPHEYTHSWNGKFRRPKDLWTANFNEPMGDSLLWVYEGQTQYWGQVLTTRSGLWSKEQALDVLAGSAAYYQIQAGRKWRNLQDTTFDELVAPRFLPQSWASWRRGADYYNEGVLLWLDVDTLIRELSHGQHSLDDFARAFFGVDDGSMTPKLYVFDDVVRALNAVQPYDWAGFLHTRLDSLGRDPLDGITRGGYRLVWNDKPGKVYESIEKLNEITSLGYSLGISLNKSGSIRGVLWDSPAYKAGLAPGEQIIAVNGMTYSAERVKNAVKDSPGATGPIELIVKDEEHVRTVPIDYHGGARYPHLERVEGAPARLDDILAAK
jgi:predicted metalloprotease with PDZ domain